MDCNKMMSLSKLLRDSKLRVSSTVTTMSSDVSLKTVDHLLRSLCSHSGALNEEDSGSMKDVVLFVKQIAATHLNVRHTLIMHICDLPYPLQLLFLEILPSILSVSITASLVEEVVSQLKKMLENDNSLLLPIIGVMVDIPLPSHITSELAQLAENALSIVEEADLPLLFRTLIRSLGQLPPREEYSVASRLREELKYLSTSNYSVVLETLWEVLPVSTRAATVFLEQIYREEEANFAANKVACMPSLPDITIVLILSNDTGIIHTKSLKLLQIWLKRNIFPFSSLQHIITMKNTNEVWDRMVPAIWGLCRWLLATLSQIGAHSSDFIGRSTARNSFKNADSTGAGKYGSIATDNYNRSCSALCELVLQLYDNVSSLRDLILSNLLNYCYTASQVEYKTSSDNKDSAALDMPPLGHACSILGMTNTSSSGSGHTEHSMNGSRSRHSVQREGDEEEEEEENGVYDAMYTEEGRKSDDLEYLNKNKGGKATVEPLYLAMLSSYVLQYLASKYGDIGEKVLDSLMNRLQPSSGVHIELPYPNITHRLIQCVIKGASSITQTESTLLIVIQKLLCAVSQPDTGFLRVLGTEHKQMRSSTNTILSPTRGDTPPIVPATLSTISTNSSICSQQYTQASIGLIFAGHFLYEKQFLVQDVRAVLKWISRSFTTFQDPSIVYAFDLITLVMNRYFDRSGKNSPSVANGSTLSSSSSSTSRDNNNNGYYGNHDTDGEDSADVKKQILHVSHSCLVSFLKTYNVGIPVIADKMLSWPVSHESSDSYPQQLMRTYYFDVHDSPVNANNTTDEHESLSSSLHRCMNLYTKDGFVSRFEHDTDTNADTDSQMDSHDVQEEDAREREGHDHLTSSDPSVWRRTPIVWNFTSLSMALTKYLQAPLSTHRDQSASNVKLLEELIKWTKDSHDMTGNSLFWGVQKLVMIHSNLTHLCRDNANDNRNSTSGDEQVDAEMAMHLTVVPELDTGNHTPFFIQSSKGRKKAKMDNKRKSKGQVDGKGIGKKGSSSLGVMDTLVSNEYLWSWPCAANDAYTASFERHSTMSTTLALRLAWERAFTASLLIGKLHSFQHSADAPEYSNLSSVARILTQIHTSKYMLRAAQAGGMHGNAHPKDNKTGSSRTFSSEGKSSRRQRRSEKRSRGHEMLSGRSREQGGVNLAESSSSIPSQSRRSTVAAVPEDSYSIQTNMIQRLLDRGCSTIQLTNLVQALWMLVTPTTTESADEAASNGKFLSEALLTDTGLAVMGCYVRREIEGQGAPNVAINDSTNDSTNASTNNKSASSSSSFPFRGPASFSHMLDVYVTFEEGCSLPSSNLLPPSHVESLESILLGSIPFLGAYIELLRRYANTEYTSIMDTSNGEDRDSNREDASGKNELRSKLTQIVSPIGESSIASHILGSALDRHGCSILLLNLMLLLNCKIEQMHVDAKGDIDEFAMIPLVRHISVRMDQADTYMQTLADQPLSGDDMNDKSKSAGYVPSGSRMEQTGEILDIDTDLSDSSGKHVVTLFAVLERQVRYTQDATVAQAGLRVLSVLSLGTALSHRCTSISWSLIRTLLTISTDISAHLYHASASSRHATVNHNANSSASIDPFGFQNIPGMDILWPNLVVFMAKVPVYDKAMDEMSSTHKIGRSCRTLLKSAFNPSPVSNGAVSWTSHKNALALHDASHISSFRMFACYWWMHEKKRDRVFGVANILMQAFQVYERASNNNNNSNVHESMQSDVFKGLSLDNADHYIAMATSLLPVLFTQVHLFSKQESESILPNTYCDDGPYAAFIFLCRLVVWTVQQLELLINHGNAFSRLYIDMAPHMIKVCKVLLGALEFAVRDAVRWRDSQQEEKQSLANNSTTSSKKRDLSAASREHDNEDDDKDEDEDEDEEDSEGSDIEVDSNDESTNANKRSRKRDDFGSLPYLTSLFEWSLAVSQWITHYSLSIKSKLMKGKFSTSRSLVKSVPQLQLISEKMSARLHRLSKVYSISLEDFQINTDIEMLVALTEPLATCCHHYIVKHDVVLKSPPDTATSWIVFDEGSHFEQNQRYLKEFEEELDERARMQNRIVFDYRQSNEDVGFTAMQSNASTSYLQYAGDLSSFQQEEAGFEANGRGWGLYDDSDDDDYYPEMDRSFNE